MRPKVSCEYQKAYIRDSRVKELREVCGVTNFSLFVREAVDEHIKKARGSSLAAQSPGTTTCKGGDLVVNS